MYSPTQSLQVGYGKGSFIIIEVGFACPPLISPSLGSSTHFPLRTHQPSTNELWMGQILPLHCREQPVCWGLNNRTAGTGSWMLTWLKPGNERLQRKKPPPAPGGFQLVGCKPRAVHDHFATMVGESNNVARGAYRRRRRQEMPDDLA